MRSTSSTLRSHARIAFSAVDSSLPSASALNTWTAAAALRRRVRRAIFVVPLSVGAERAVRLVPPHGDGASSLSRRGIHHSDAEEIAARPHVEMDADKVACETAHDSARYLAQIASHLSP